MKLAHWLKQNRKRQAELASAVRRSPSQISRIANGRSRPSWELVERIHGFTGGAVTATDFIDDPPRPLQTVTQEEAA